MKQPAERSTMLQVKEWVIGERFDMAGDVDTYYLSIDQTTVTLYKHSDNDGVNDGPVVTITLDKISQCRVCL